MEQQIQKDMHINRFRGHFYFGEEDLWSRNWLLVPHMFSLWMFDTTDL